MGNAGRVLMIPKGDYNPATPYEMLDCVYYNGRSYVCKQASTGHAPTDTTYWQPMTPDASAEIQALTNQLTDEVSTRAMLGAHNLLRYKDNWQTSSIPNGITASIETDGGVKLLGTVSPSNAIFPIYEFVSPYTVLAIATCDAPDTNEYFVITNVTDGTTLGYLADDPITLSLVKGKTYRFELRISNGTSMGEGITLHPMLRLATDANTNYEAPAKTNVELTQESVVQTATWKDSTTNFDFTVTKKNGICILCNSSSNGSVVSSGAPVEVGTIPTGFRPSTETRSMGIFGDSAVFAVIATTGGSLRFGTWSQKTISNAFFEIVYPCAE